MQRDGRSSMLRNVSATTLSAWTAHALAWAAGVWLAFGPAYQGVSVTPGGETTWVTATFLETNGLHVLWVLVVPILLTGVGLLGIRLTDKGETGRKALLWGLVVVFLGFCALGMFSFGWLYAPVALALLVAAATDLGGQPAV